MMRWGENLRAGEQGAGVMVLCVVAVVVYIILSWFGDINLCTCVDMHT